MSHQMNQYWSPFTDVNFLGKRPSKSASSRRSPKKVVTISTGNSGFWGFWMCCQDLLICIKYLQFHWIYICVQFAVSVFVTRPCLQMMRRVETTLNQVQAIGDTFWFILEAWICFLNILGLL